MFHIILFIVDVSYQEVGSGEGFLVSLVTYNQSINDSDFSVSAGMISAGMIGRKDC